MATITLQEMRDLILQNVGVLAAGESAKPEDAQLVQAAIESNFSELRNKELAPFELTAIPDWAQIALRDMVSFDVAQLYVTNPQRRVELAQLRQFAMRRLQAQTASPPSSQQIKLRWL